MPRTKESGIRYGRDHYERQLRERWNVAMTAAGFVGSEFIDEPERIAEEVRRMREDIMQLRRERVLLRRTERPE